MTFRDVAIKNFKFNIRKYKAYILSCSFSVMIFFMYLTLYFNRNIAKKFGGTPIHDIMTAVLVVIIFYNTFFMNYAQASFFKSRKKEFGLFLTLGMVKKDINSMLIIENVFISLTSMLIGLISGAVFSRIFFMITVKVLASEEIKFSLNLKSFILSVLIFMCIFLMTTFMTLTRTSRLSISELFIADRRLEENKIKSPIIAIAGGAFIAISYILMYYYMKGQVFKKNENSGIIFILVLSFLGTYILISQTGALIISFMKKNKTTYYKSIISITEINYKFKQYKKILYLICILSALIVFFIGLTYGMQMSALKTVLGQNPYDIMYIETYDQNKLSQKQINDILNTSESGVTAVKTLNFAEISLKRNSELWGDVPVVSDKELDTVINTKVHVRRGYAISTKGLNKNDWCKGFKKLQLGNDEKSKYVQFYFQEEINKDLVNFNNENYNSMIILNDSDYKSLLSKIDKTKLRKFHLFNFENWRKTKSVSENLISKLKQVDNISNKKSDNELFEDWDLYPASKIQSYEHLKVKTSFMLFVMCCIGVIFFISSGVILYFKIYTDIEDGKERYNKLYRIGIMDFEMKKFISNELKIIFFVPVLLGSILGYLYIFSITSGYKEIMLNALIPIAVYFMFQTIFYNITKEKYIKEIMG